MRWNSPAPPGEVGFGVTALATQYYIFEEVKEGNKMMLEKQKELEKRIAKLEKL